MLLRDRGGGVRIHISNGWIEQPHLVEWTDGVLNSGFVCVESAVGGRLVRRDCLAGAAEGGPQVLLVGAEKRRGIVGASVRAGPAPFVGRGGSEVKHRACGPSPERREGVVAEVHQFVDEPELSADGVVVVLE